MQEKDIEMDINDVWIVKQHIEEIEAIGMKYNLPAYSLIEKVSNIEQVKV